MSEFLKLLAVIPSSVRVVIVAVVLGIGIAYAHETRYMTVSDFTKSYVLDLKKTIRELNYELRRPDLTPRERIFLEEQIANYVAELCYEMPSDPQCRP